MNISMKDAITHFFTNPSFDLIYSEALANALDAGASQIKIEIDIKGFDKPNTLNIIIEDNGNGFTDQNFKKFSTLLLKEDEHHKGLGRLVYLRYFSNVHIESVFSEKRKRVFDFNDDFHGNSEISPLETPINNYTKLSFTCFRNTRLKSYDNLIPERIRENFLKQFMPRLYAMKQQGKDFQLSIRLTTEETNPEKKFYSGNAILTLNDLPKLQEIKIEDKSLDLFHTEFSMLYLVEQNWEEKPITAICVDGRAFELQLLKDAVIPSGTHAIFLLQSSFFDSKVDDSRQELSLDPKDQAIIEDIFVDKISEVLNLNVPAIVERNQETQKRLSARYPHLTGFFGKNSIGLIDEDKSVFRAQEAFFKEQKEILCADELTEEQYNRSLNHATRILTEYILYRNLIIKKLGGMRKEHPEAKIHDLIVPMQREFSSENLFDEMYNNNAWLLDDKYMGYRSILSDKNIQELIEKISDEEELQSNDLRPDIAFVFSDDIETVNHPVDVVIVELKKKGLGYLDNMRVVDQIKQRARRLVSLYPNKIQRMWFFGVIEFDKEVRLEVKENHWIKLYSTGELYYKEIETIPVDKDLNQLSENAVPVFVMLMSFEALWQDAKTRNETFLNILKAGIQRFVEKREKASLMQSVNTPQNTLKDV